MRRMQTGRWMMAGALLLAGLGASRGAEAQTASGWALNRFEPTPAGDVFCETTEAALVAAVAFCGSPPNPGFDHAPNEKAIAPRTDAMDRD